MPIMETVAKRKRARRAFDPAFKADIVRLHVEEGRSIADLVREFDLVESAVRSWVKQARIDGGERDGLTSEERAELTRLRQENRRLQQDVEILKREGASLHRGGEGWRPQRLSGL
jgi:transposase